MAMLNNQRVLYIGSILGGPRHWVHFRWGRVFIRLVGDVRVSVEKIKLGMARSHQQVFFFAVGGLFLLSLLVCKAH